MTPEQFIDELLGLESIKVWSLIVTLFGDLGREKPGSVSGKELRELLSPTGIKPEAIRVALHRLKKDGWMTSSKDGRQSIYRLSKDGLEQTQLAYDDVYRTDVKFKDGWALHLLREEVVPQSPGSIGVAKNLFLIPREASRERLQSMELKFDDVPDWFLQKIVPLNVQRVADHYAAIAEHLKQVLASGTAKQKAVIRLLVLHHWRKMALRDNTWCHIWMFPDGVFARSHRMVSSFLNEPPIVPARSD